MPGAPLIRLAVAVLLAAAPMRVAAATLVPGGGGRRTDCIMQMSAEGVGFPAGKKPKGVSCADGDVCDLDGQRNGVCLFGVSLCLNEPTRACQPRSVKRATVKAKKKSGVDVTSLQAALAAIPLPTSDTVCSAAALISVPTRGPGGHGRVRSRKVALKASARAGSHKDSDTYRLTCVPTTVGGGGGSTPTTTPVTTTTSTTTSIPIPPAQPGAGLVSQITAATVNAQGVVTITFTLTDAAGVPLIPFHRLDRRPEAGACPVHHRTPRRRQRDHRRSDDHLHALPQLHRADARAAGIRQRRLARARWTPREASTRTPSPRRCPRASPRRSRTRSAARSTAASETRRCVRTRCSISCRPGARSRRCAR